MEYANEFHEIKKEEETDEECADESWPVERRELVDDDSNSKPQPQRENRVTPDQAVFNYLYQHKRSDLLETMFDEETRVEYTNKVENMGAAIPQIQRLYAYYRRHKPVKKEAVEESTDSRRGVVEVEAAVETPSARGHTVKDSQPQEVTNLRRSARLRARSVVKKPDVVEVDNEESGNDDPKRRPQSTPRENGPIHLNDSAVLMLNVQPKDKRTSPSDLKITPQLAIFYHLYERNRRDVLAEIFDEETRKELTRKVEKMGIDMPSILRMYAYWRRTELKRTVKNGIEIWLVCE
ncbi:hypothetical protein QR680_007067 [Steinernema hermaphroditum]|uniref:Uncharacterized protein n=1 Tax=Steinernema hermaphroditum TaxID=289476 RepID=A0AA39HZR5_9BILA|nr:hypothetical protein QR680_007067 [Steinernema hermaphroditum]